jgi:AcrR family transcriptional regulator
LEQTTSLQEKRIETERKIMDAAKAVFAEVGFSGARIDEIAKRAGVNKAMIYYRIGDKEALYAQVLHSLFNDLASRLTTRMKEDLSPEKKLRAYIREVGSTVEQHPYMPPIMMRELASGGQNFPELAARGLVSILDFLKKILDEGKEKGQFHQTMPFTFHLMVISALISSKNIENIINKYESILQIVDGMEIYFPENISEEVAEILLRAIKR